MRAAILAGGRLTAGAAARRRLRSADLLICADGGLHAARRLDLRPDVAVGDFDSAPTGLQRWAHARGTSLIRHPVEKDKTDAELALDYALARGAAEVEFFGALGGRLDHELANIALLLRAHARRARMRIVEGRTAAFLASGRTPIRAAPGTLVSLLPLSRTVRGVTTRGLRYRLRRATLRAGSSLGVSNEVVARGASVTAGRGDLLIVVTQPRGTDRRARA